MLEFKYIERRLLAGKPMVTSQNVGSFLRLHSNGQGPVARSLVSANRWLRGIKTYRFPWYLTLVSTNHASSNPGLENKIWPFWVSMKLA